MQYIQRFFHDHIKKNGVSGSSPTGKPLRKLMHSPPSRWFVLPASVVWAGLHVPRRWDEKEKYIHVFLGGKGWGGGGGVLGCLDVCFCLNVFFGCCVFECFFLGAVKWCIVFLFKCFLFLVNSCECLQRFSIVSFDVETHTIKLMVFTLKPTP